MAVVTPGHKFHALAADVPTKETGSAYTNGRSEYWSIEDIKESVGLAVGADIEVGQLKVQDLLLLSSEELPAAMADISVTKTITSLNLATAQINYTLPAGTNGMIKVLNVISDDGVGSAKINIGEGYGWGSSSFFMLNHAGDGCILVYLNDKWNLIGNHSTSASPSS